jgi:hypothetical protein
VCKATNRLLLLKTVRHQTGKRERKKKDEEKKGANDRGRQQMRGRRDDIVGEKEKGLCSCSRFGSLAGGSSAGRGRAGCMRKTCRDTDAREEAGRSTTYLALAHKDVLVQADVVALQPPRA